ncbi:MAG: ATP-binding cassette domain-containing protein [Polyangiaceae bacterium]|nr:ATP-binding cassette domain-containing protein [Polyangiaceae bacterium]MCW5790342.1 ATP-binding cassette domain-containing protein [Polyangiaceae bacterium]
MIEAHALAKRFGEVQAVRDVSFHAPDGAITGLLGPNGAGKTTTLRMIYGLTRPDAGHVKVDSIDVQLDPRDAQRRLGVVPDQRGLYPRLTTVEHIEYFGRLHGLSRSVLRDRVPQLIEELGLQSIAKRRVSGFSQGERAKVAIARALIHHPQNLVFDEPTNGLDVMATRSVREVLRALRDRGRSVVFSSHLMQEVRELCDHVVIVADAHVVAQGTPSELLEQTGAPDLETAFVSLTSGSRC